MNTRWLRLAAWLLTTLPLLCCSGESANAGEREPASVLPTQELNTCMNEAGVPGVSITVIEDFEIDWTFALGVADASSQRPVTSTTLFQAASISKPEMAVASAVLAGQGDLDLDGDVAMFLHSWRVPQRSESASFMITPRMLLSHTSGLADGLGFPGYKPSEPLPGTLRILNGVSPAKTVAIRQSCQQ